jgi:hypothetical protein
MLAMAPETLLLTGMGFSLLLGTIATSDVNMRYVLPSVPLLALGGTRALASGAAGIRGVIASRSSGVVRSTKPDDLRPQPRRPSENGA